MTPFKTSLSSSSFLDLEGNTDTSVPLLAETAVLMIQEREEEHGSAMEKGELNMVLRRYISIVGVVVGVLSVLSDLGAHAIFLLPGTYLHLVLHTYTESVFFAMTWTVVFTSVVMYALHSVLTIVTVSYRMGSSNVKALLSEEDLFQLEGKFLLGTLVGTCTMWGLIDAATGMTHGVWCSIGALVVTVAVGKILIQCGRPGANRNLSSEESRAEILVV